MGLRIYWQSLFKKYGYALGVVPVAILFAFLISQGVIIPVDYTGNTTCAGTLEDPCIAEMTFNVTQDFFLYRTNYDPYGRDTPVDLNPGVKSWKLYRSWGDGWREIPLNEGCKGTYCGCSWCTADNPAEFAYAFREGRQYTLKLEVLKNNPYDDVKWSFTNEIDPLFEGVGVENQYKDANVSYSRLDYENANGTRTVILYSGTRYGYEDNHWKPVEDLKSFKGTTNIKCIVQEDNQTNVECLDWNATSVKLNVELKDSKAIGKDIPIYTKSIIINETTGKEEIIKESKRKESFNSIGSKKGIIITNNMKEIHIGENSTTIILQDADTENLDDSWMYQLNGDTNYGSDNELEFFDYGFDTYERHIIVKFNISHIINYSSGIHSANLHLNINSNGLDSGEYIRGRSYHVYSYPDYNISNSEWNESSITWNNVPSSSSEYNTTYMDQTTINSGDSSSIYNVTSAIRTEYNENDSKVTIYIKPSDWNLNSNLDDIVKYSSKEYATSADRPYLNLTVTNYTFPTAPTSPTNITCDGGSCNDTFGGTINMNCSGSIDVNEDTITYVLYYENDSEITAVEDVNASEWCTNSGSSSCSFSNYIDRVQFAGIDKDTACEGDYADYTSETSNLLTAGENYTLNVTVPSGASENYVTANFDWNQDNTFDETVNVGKQSVDGNTMSATISVPEDAIVGSSIMRIITDYSDYCNPCETGDNWYGVEDYSIGVNGTIINYTYMGNHTEGTTYSWDLSAFSVGEVFESFKCYATDGTANSANYIQASNFTVGAGGTPDINVSLNSALSLLRFLNCSPDWTYYPSQPENQTDAVYSAIAINNGTAAGSFNVSLTGAARTGWTLYQCNDSSSSDPASDGDCLTLSTSWQTFATDVAADANITLWFYANCSSVAGNPNTDFNYTAY